MKVPDLAQVTGNEEKSKKPGNVDLGKVRKKKKQAKHLAQLIAILIIAILVAVVWINADTIFEPLRGIASKIDNKTTLKVGFPVELTGSGDYSIMRFGNNFSLLTDTYLYTYDTSGAQLYALKHGYSHPEQTTSEKRIMLFDKSGNNFAVYSKSSLMYQNSVEDKIVYSSIGNDGLAAVVTDSKRYSNVLYVYDDGGNWKYTKKFADENVIQVSMVGDGNHLVVATLSAQHGDIITNFRADDTLYFDLKQNALDLDAIYQNYNLQGKDAAGKNTISLHDNVLTITDKGNRKYNITLANNYSGNVTLANKSGQTHTFNL